MIIPKKIQLLFVELFSVGPAMNLRYMALNGSIMFSYGVTMNGENRLVTHEPAEFEK